MKIHVQSKLVISNIDTAERYVCELYIVVVRFIAISIYNHSYILNIENKSQEIKQHSDSRMC
jgi:hypothetical protein